MLRRRAAAGAAGVCVVVAAALSGCTGGTDAVDQQAGGEFRYVGVTPRGHVIPMPDRKTAGDATAPYLSGAGTFHLSSLKGQVVVMNYWATWCSPCITETPAFDTIYRSVRSQKIAFVGVDVKETSKSKAQAFVADNHISYPMVFDEIGRTALQLGKVPLVSLPSTVVIDRAGRVAAVYGGIQLAGDLTPVLTRLAAETG